MGWGDFGQNFVRKDRPEQIFDQFANIGPEDYEENMNYGFGQDDPGRWNNFSQEPIPSASFNFSAGGDIPGPAMENRLQQIGDNVAAPSNKPFDVQEYFNQLYHPETAASGRFNELIAGYPQHEKTGLGRAIVASMIAAKDPKASQEFMEFPHAHAIANWKQQIEPAQKAADLERASNVNERTLAYQMSQAELGRRKADETERNNRDRTRIAQQRADVYEAAKNDPNYFIDINGPNMIMVNRKTGERTTSVVPTDDLSDVEKLRIQAQNAENLERLRTRGDIQVKQSTPGGGRTGDLPTQDLVAEFLRARKLYDNPEFRKFITIDPTGKSYRLSQPGTNWLGDPSGPTQAQYDYMNQYIHGSSSPAPAPNKPSNNGGAVYEGPDPDAGMPRTPMTSGSTILDGTVQKNNRTGQTRTMRNGQWVYGS